MPLYSDHIRLHLANGPATAKKLQQKLQVSQPTLSRALAQLGNDVVRTGAGRSIQYLLRDHARGFDDIPVYRVDAQGQLHPLGVLTPVRPDGFVMRQTNGKTLYSEGMPWWLMDMRPQGFLGRAYASRHAAHLGLPASVREWSDTDAMRALLAHGHEAVGNLLLGERARAHFLDAPPPAPIATPHKATAYTALAQRALQGDTPVSSAGGEQPKFTTVADTPNGVRHVLVKFSLPDDNAITERWRDLLLAEHHALETLRRAGIDAAQSWVLDHNGQRFLEVERFDRVGDSGRCGLFSLSALEAEFVGQAQTAWPVLVEPLAQQGVVNSAAPATTQQLFAFGRLIGNSDMHTGNLSFVGDGGRPYALAPAYDMLPMAFAPHSGGGLTHHLPPLELHPSVAHGVWHAMLPVARDYLNRLLQDERFSGHFAPCLTALGEHLNTASRRIARLG